MRVKNTKFDTVSVHKCPCFVVVVVLLIKMTEFGIIKTYPSLMTGMHSSLSANSRAPCGSNNFIITYRFKSKRRHITDVLANMISNPTPRDHEFDSITTQPFSKINFKQSILVPIVISRRSLSPSRKSSRFGIDEYNTIAKLVLVLRTSNRDTRFFKNIFTSGQ